MESPMVKRCVVLQLQSIGGLKVPSCHGVIGRCSIISGLSRLIKHTGLSRMLCVWGLEFQWKELHQ